jgi:hypothetical protein
VESPRRNVDWWATFGIGIVVGQNLHPHMNHDNPGLTIWGQKLCHPIYRRNLGCIGTTPAKTVTLKSLRAGAHFQVYLALLSWECNSLCSNKHNWV